MIVQFLLTCITLGLYAPIAWLKIQGYILSKLSYDGTAFAFNTDDGCDFWCLVFVQSLLTIITFGIYAPWAELKISRNVLNRTSIDGRQFDLTAEGGKYFSLLLGQLLLTMITLGIYTPWAIAAIYNYLISEITWGEEKFNMKMEGAKLFCIFFAGVILTMLTLGIYFPWFEVKLLKYYADTTEVQ